MVLSARPIRDVFSVNSFRVADRGAWQEGDATTFYFQLIDTSVDLANEGYSPPFRRYMPAAGATLTLTFNSLDMSRVVTRTATQPFAQDPSVWQVTVLSTDKIRGTVSVSLSLNESGRITTCLIQPMVNVTPKGVR